MGGRASSLRIGGLVPLSSVDWPGELAATVFLQGCPWRCSYCHNQHLLTTEAAEGDALVPWSDVRDFLATRVGLLDGVVFTGGEPLAQSAVADAIAEVRAMGFRVALHTGGVMPERFESLLPLLDWVGFDVKAPFGDYERVTCSPGSGERALRSLQALVASGVPFEVRTTVHADVLSAGDLRQLGEELAAESVRTWVLQPFRTDGSPLDLPHASIDFERIAEDLRALVPGVAVR